MMPVHPSDLTPVERHGGFLVKCEHLCGLPHFSGVVGGKLRQAWATAQARTGPLITWGGRRSNTAAAFAAVGAELGRATEFHTAAGDPTAEMTLAEDYGAEVIRHRPGYLSLCRVRARHSGVAKKVDIGPDWKAVIEAVAHQVESLYPHQPTRVVTAVGSGLTLVGILVGLRRWSPQTRVLGVTCGGTPPGELLAAHAPKGWDETTEFVGAHVPYDREVTASLGGLRLDPIYESKAFRHLEPGDLLWNLGCRNLGE